MKVYATVEEGGEIKLVKWSSIAKFLLNERWCDEKFINVVTTKDLVNYEEPKNTMIVYTDQQVKSHAILQGLYLNEN